LAQLAAKAGATVIAVGHTDATERLRGYGTAEVIDHVTASLGDKLRGSRPAGVGVLIDPASDDAQFSALAERCPAGTSYVSRWVWRARRG
jgi:NADPH:quinone reductase-like Zn-dependent oxidoreductase